jgi:hypothetical protein
MCIHVLDVDMRCVLVLFWIYVDVNAVSIHVLDIVEICMNALVIDTYYFAYTSRYMA